MQNVGAAISNTQSLGQERAANAFLADETTSPFTNEGNLLSLQTLRAFAEKKNDQASVNAIDSIGYEESRYLLKAMQALTGDESDPQSIRLKAKFGRDLNGAVSLGRYLKQNADEAEAKALVSDWVDSLARVPRGDAGVMGE